MKEKDFFNTDTKYANFSGKSPLSSNKTEEKRKKKIFQASNKL